MKKKLVHPRIKSIRRGRLAKKLEREGMSIADIASIWQVHPLTVKWYTMEARHARQNAPGNG